jgi:hypothetical protein
MNQTLKNQLTKFILETRLPWTKCLSTTLLRIRAAPWKGIGLSPYEMLPYLISVTDVPSFETKDYFPKIIYLDCPLLYFVLGKKLLAQSPPLDFPVHPHQPGNYVLIKTWKENKHEPAWDRPFLVLLTMETAIQTAERGWTHHTQVKKAPST